MKQSSVNPLLVKRISAFVRHRLRLTSVMILVLGFSLAVRAETPAKAQDASATFELDQGWSDSWRNEWYSKPQGSRLIPLAWLRALEQPDNQNLFMNAEHVAKFRYLACESKCGAACGRVCHRHW